MVGEKKSRMRRGFTRLGMRRQWMGLSQDELGARARVTQARVSLAERGLLSVSDEDATRLSEVLGCPVKDLFGDDGLAITWDGVLSTEGK